MRNWLAIGHTGSAAPPPPGVGILATRRWKIGASAFALALAPGLLFSGPPSAAASFTPITVGQTGTGWDGGASNSSLKVTFSKTTTAGDLLVAAFQLRNTTEAPSLGKVSDSNGNALTKGVALQYQGQMEAGIFYEADAPSATSITITPAQKGDTIVATIYDVVGAATVSPLDVTSSDDSCTVATATTGSTPITQFPYELGIGSIAWNQAPTLGGETGGFTLSPAVQATTSGEMEGQQAAYLQTSSFSQPKFSGLLSSTVCWTGVVATFAAASQVKPDIAGLLDRGSSPASAVGGSNFTLPTRLPAGWAGTVVTGIVVNETWADLQPNGAGTPIIASANGNGDSTCNGSAVVGSCLDQAIADVASWNASNPSLPPMAIKLRVWAGEDAPEWAKDIGGPISGTSGNTIGAFWTSSYESDFDNLMAQLASLYDAGSLVTDVEGSACMTEYDEPMLHDDFSSGAGLTNLLNAGYTDAADYACLTSDITSLANWKQTHVALSFNPWDLLTLPTNGSPEVIDGVSCSKPSPCEALTENFMATFASSLGKQAALANHSIRYGENSGTGYSSMYAHIASDATTDGATVQYQTATLANLEGSGTCTTTVCEGLSEALNWACGATDKYQTMSSGQTASAVELPGGYTDAVFAPYDDFTTPASYAPYLSCIQKDTHG